jgi:hypothetical protein
MQNHKHDLHRLPSQTHHLYPQDSLYTGKTTVNQGRHLKFSSKKQFFILTFLGIAFCYIGIFTNTKSANISQFLLLNMTSFGKRLKIWGYRYCLALLDPSQRNWFCKSQLTSIVAIGLCKPYAKTKVGDSCTSRMFIDSVDGCR